MTEGRCDLILLGWTAFIGFNLISDFLWSSGGRQGDGGRLPASGLSSPGTELYRGSYWMESNGTVVEKGALRMSLVSHHTGVSSVQISSISMSLLTNDGAKHGGGSFASQQSKDLVFSGIELGDVGRLTATGAADPSRFGLFGQRACRVDAVVHVQSSESRTQQTTEDGDAGPDDADAGRDGGATSTTMAGQVSAVECGFSVHFDAETIDIMAFTQKVVHYSIWTNLLTILQIRCFLLQMRHTEEGPSAAKVSILCIAMQALMDAYDSFLHLALGLSTQYMFNTIAVVSLFKFILFSLLEARYLLAIWRQRRQEAFGQGWESVRRELSWLYSRFYGVLIIGLVFIYNNLQYLDSIALAFQAYWVPQILHDAWQGTRSAVCPAFLAGISATRSLLVLYLWGCPEGIFSGDVYPRLPNSPSLSVCASAVALQAAQVAVMMLQKALGPRFFVPWVCMPNAYNYHRTAGRVGETGAECVICMSEIDVEDARRVVTPCNHVFHQACLEQWMDVKMECPTCRTVLPPIQ